MKKHIGKATLELAQGDITALEVDAIVNAANVHLEHGGGVAWAIARKAGRELQDESRHIIFQRGGPLRTCEAIITRGYKLPARHVIHTVGPIWDEQGEAESDR